MNANWVMHANGVMHANWLMHLCCCVLSRSFHTLRASLACNFCNVCTGEEASSGTGTAAAPTGTAQGTGTKAGVPLYTCCFLPRAAQHNSQHILHTQPILHHPPTSLFPHRSSPSPRHLHCCSTPPRPHQATSALPPLGGAVQQGPPSQASCRACPCARVLGWCSPPTAPPRATPSRRHSTQHSRRWCAPDSGPPPPLGLLPRPPLGVPPLAPQWPPWLPPTAAVALRLGPPHPAQDQGPPVAWGPAHPRRRTARVGWVGLLRRCCRCRDWTCPWLPAPPCLLVVHQLQMGPVHKGPP